MPSFLAGWYMGHLDTTKKDISIPKKTHPNYYTHFLFLGWGEIFSSKIRRPQKTTFDMTTLIFSARGCPSYLFYSFERAIGTLVSWLVT